MFIFNSSKIIKYNAIFIFIYLFIKVQKREYKECRQKSFTSTEFLRSHFYATSIFESFLVIRTNQIFKNILFEYTHKKKITRKKY